MSQRSLDLANGSADAAASPGALGAPIPPNPNDMPTRGRIIGLEIAQTRMVRSAAYNSRFQRDPASSNTRHGTKVRRNGLWTATPSIDTRTCGRTSKTNDHVASSAIAPMKPSPAPPEKASMTEAATMATIPRKTEPRGRRT